MASLFSVFFSSNSWFWTRFLGSYGSGGLRGTLRTFLSYDTAVVVLVATGVTGTVTQNNWTLVVM